MLAERKVYLIMLLPAILYFVVFHYLPMTGIVVAFQDYNLRDKFFSPFVGWRNFDFLLLTGDIKGVIRNTVLYNLAFILLGNAIQIAVAIVLAEIGGKRFRKAAQSVLILPYFVSWVIVGAFAYNLFNYETGLLNALLTQLGMERADVYNTPALWPFIIVIFALWKSVGYGSVVYLAAIMGIDAEIYEAAEIDGANVFQRIVGITLPSLVPTMVVLVLLSLGNIFRGDFNMFYQLVGNNYILLPYTDVIDTFVTRSLLTANDIGMSAAAGLIQSVFGFAVIVTVNQLIRWNNKEYSLF